MKNRTKLHIAPLLACLLAAGASLSAQTIASWDFNGIDLDNLDPANNHELAAGSTAEGIAQVTLRLGPGVNHTTASGQYGFKIPNADAQNSLAGAIASGHYIEFTLTAAPGGSLNLNSLEFNGQSAATGADNIALLSSVGGFTESAAIVTRSNIAGSTGGFDTDNSGFGGPIDLSAAEYQNIASVTFRLYGWNTSGSTGATYPRNLSGDDLVIHGTASVPEPASASLLTGGLALLGLLARGGMKRPSCLTYNLTSKAVR